MVLGNVFSVFRASSKSTEPRFNIAFASSASESMFGSGNLHVKKFLIDLYKTTPELNALINKVCSDIAGNFHFIPLDNKSSARNKILEAEKYALNNQLKTVLLNQSIDWQVTGEGYSWKKGPDKSQIKEAIYNQMRKKFGINSKEAKYYADIAYLNFIEKKGTYEDEDYMKPRLLRYVASSTMDVIYDETDIKSFIQRVGTRDVEYDLNETIRITDLMVDGKPYGFTPVMALIPQIELAKMMWRNQKALQKNGGAMSKIFAFEDMKVESPSYKRVEEQLNAYKQVENKHSNMLMTGKLAVHDITTMDGLQYKDVGLYVLSIIAMNWNVPRSMLPVILGNTNSKSDIGGEAEKGYWSNIEKKQDRLAEIYNTQLFIPHFGVKLVFNKEYKQDDVQENTALQLKLNNLEMTNRLLSVYKKQLNMNSALKRLGLNEDDLEAAEEMAVESGMLRQNMPGSSVMKNNANQNYAEKKKNEEMAREEGRGKPSGV